MKKDNTLLWALIIGAVAFILGWSAGAQASHDGEESLLLSPIIACLTEEAPVKVLELSDDMRKVIPYVEEQIRAGVCKRFSEPYSLLVSFDRVVRADLIWKGNGNGNGIPIFIVEVHDGSGLSLYFWLPQKTLRDMLDNFMPPA